MLSNNFHSKSHICKVKKNESSHTFFSCACFCVKLKRYHRNSNVIVFLKFSLRTWYCLGQQSDGILHDMQILKKRTYFMC